MNILIVEPNHNFAFLIQRTLEANFKNLNLIFEKDGDRIVKIITELSLDLAVVECRFGADNLFEFLKLFLDRNIPFILMADNPSVRLVSEAMRFGAIDFVEKKEYDAAIFVKVVTRVILEADRWQKRHEFMDQLFVTPRPVLDHLDIELRSLANQELQPPPGTAARSRSNPVDGKVYHMTFIDIVYIPPRLRQFRADDSSKIINISNKIMHEIARIQDEAAGIQWAWHEKSLLYGYVDETASHCLQTAFLIHGFITEFRFDLYEFDQKPSISMSLAGCPAVYRLEKGELYSEALNLAAHVASEAKNQKKIIISEDFYKDLNGLEKRYFRESEKFKTYLLYEFLAL